MLKFDAICTTNVSPMQEMLHHQIFVVNQMRVSERVQRYHHMVLHLQDILLQYYAEVLHPTAKKYNHIDDIRIHINTTGEAVNLEEHFSFPKKSTHLLRALFCANAMRFGFALVEPGFDIRLLIWYHFIFLYVTL